uniref:Uncharacterized protein n=1 Tax=viral metagenome TaxID=1070528 RepID=A0A6C0E182_9ZZZZ
MPSDIDFSEGEAQIEYVFNFIDTLQAKIKILESEKKISEKEISEKEISEKSNNEKYNKLLQEYNKLLQEYTKLVTNIINRSENAGIKIVKKETDGRRNIPSSRGDGKRSKRKSPKRKSPKRR